MSPDSRDPRDRRAARRHTEHGVGHSAVCKTQNTPSLWGIYTVARGEWRLRSALAPLGMRHTALCLSGSAKTQARGEAVYAYAIVRPAP